jgi:hypothetical protein
MMMFKDQKMLAEAYITATQKNTPMDASEPDVPNSTIEMSPDAPEVSINLEPSDISDDSEECSCGDHEHEELSMAKTNLFALFTSAKMIHDAILEGYELEPWMLQKIAIVSDSISNVAKKVHYDVVASEAGI